MSGTTDIAKIRDLIGDADASDQLLDDTSIGNAISAWTVEVDDSTNSVNIYGAAADCAGMIAAKLGRDVTFGEDTQFYNLSDRPGHFREVEDRLRRRAGGKSVRMTLAGTVVAT